MDLSAVIQIIILIILLGLSAFFSSAETSLTTINKIRLRSLAEEGNRHAKMALKVTDNSGKMLSSILIGNNIVNLSASALTTSIAYNFGGSAVAVATGLITVLILILERSHQRLLQQSTLRRSLSICLSDSFYYDDCDSNQFHRKYVVSRYSSSSPRQPERKSKYND